MSSEINWYGPHACSVCGVTIVKAAREQGGQELEPPERLMRVFHRGSEVGNPDLVYPSIWIPHVHRKGGPGEANTDTPFSRGEDVPPSPIDFIPMRSGVASDPAATLETRVNALEISERNRWWIPKPGQAGESKPVIANVLTASLSPQDLESIVNQVVQRVQLIEARRKRDEAAIIAEHECRKTESKRT
jgi:hypothetical protein